jgi:hypothetical protein
LENAVTGIAWVDHSTHEVDELDDRDTETDDTRRGSRASDDWTTLVRCATSIDLHRFAESFGETKT